MEGFIIDTYVKPYPRPNIFSRMFNFLSPQSANLLNSVQEMWNFENQQN